MQKPQSKIDKNLKTMGITMLALIMAGVALIGCGGSSGGGSGGGGSSSGALAYTGISTPASIDENNAKDLSQEAYDGGSVEESLPSLAALNDPPASQGGSPFLLNLSMALESAMIKVDPGTAAMESAPRSARSQTETIAGSCSGSATYQISADDQSGIFSGTITFSNYCEGDTTLNGSASFSGRIDTTNYTPISFSYTFSRLSGTSAGQTVVLDGTLAMDLTSQPMVVTINMVLQEGSQTYKIQDYRMEVTSAGSYEEITISGRFYHPDYGYITISTPTAVRIYSVDTYPSAGIVLVTGENGSEGGPTRARMTILDNTSYEIEADTNGDGTYDYGPVEHQWNESA